MAIKCNLGSHDIVSLDNALNGRVNWGFEKNDLVNESDAADTNKPKRDNSQDNDMVNHPSHYTYGKYEVIEVIEDWKLNYHLGNAVKYIARAGHKNDYCEDLRKAVWYINRAIEKYQCLNSEVWN